MKALLITFVVVGVAVFGIINFGGVMDFDPAAQASEFRSQAVPGATWQTLVEQAKPQAYSRVDAEGFGMTAGRPIDYDQKRFAERFADGDFPAGFVLHWAFGASDLIDLHFDAQGKLRDATEPISTQDLLDGTAVQKLQN
jgi:hypothetical protein